MRVPLALFIGLHAIAHLVGFAGSWRLSVPEGIPYRTTVFGGRVDLGDIGIRAIGILWLLTAIAFLIAATGVMTGAAWWMTGTLGVAIASLGLCLLEWPQARIGAVVNVALICILLLLTRWPWTLAFPR
jgi:hypothetical protein